MAFWFLCKQYNLPSLVVAVQEAYTLDWGWIGQGRNLAWQEQMMQTLTTARLGVCDGHPRNHEECSLKTCSTVQILSFEQL